MPREILAIAAICFMFGIAKSLWRADGRGGRPWSGRFAFGSWAMADVSASGEVPECDGASIAASPKVRVDIKIVLTYTYPPLRLF